MTLIGLISIGLMFWAALALIMLVAWAVERRTGNSGWIDVFWTFGIAVAVLITIFIPFGGHAYDGARAGLIGALVLIWAARLGIYVARRTGAVGDDPRYAHFKTVWGTDAGRNMFWLCQAQALLSVPMGLSIYLAAHNPLPLLAPTDVAALLVFATGLAGSAVSDAQLASFKQNSRGSNTVCDVGLWAWSRHPNYFFEWLIWLSYALFALDLSGRYALGYLAIIGPVCIYWLLTRVSGIPPLEQHMLRKYGDAYKRYQARTSAFFPRPPQVRSHQK